MNKLLTVLAGAAVLAVGACSGGDGKGAAAPPAATPSAATSTTAAPRPGSVVQAASFTPRLQAAMKGAGTMHLSIQVDTAGTPGVSGEGDVSIVDGVEEHLTLKAGSMPMEIIFKGQAIYLRSSALPVGNKWIVAREGGTDALSKQMAPLFAQIKQMRPDEQVSNYAVADQKVVGQETVDGVATTHFTSSPSAAAITKSLSPSLAGSLSAGDLTDITVDLWVDAQNRPHKVVSSMKLKGQKVATTLLMSRFGEPVSITAPPASQTTTAPQ